MLGKNIAKKKFILGLGSFLLFFLFLFPLFGADKVKAQHGLEGTASAAGLEKGGGLQSIAGNVIGNLLSMVGVLFFILVVYGGVLWMTARGDEDQVARGRNTIIAASIGIVIILASYALTDFVLGALQDGGGTGGGTQAQAGETCQTNADCASGLECALTGPEQGVCQKEGIGDSCQDNDDCPGDLVCALTGPNQGVCQEQS